MIASGIRRNTARHLTRVEANLNELALLMRRSRQGGKTTISVKKILLPQTKPELELPPPAESESIDFGSGQCSQDTVLGLSSGSDTATDMPSLIADESPFGEDRIVVSLEPAGATK